MIKNMVNFFYRLIISINKKNVFILALFLLIVSPFISILCSFYMQSDDNPANAPYVVVLGGGINGERSDQACRLYKNVSGINRIYLTGGNQELLLDDRKSYLINCGIPESIIFNVDDLKNTYQEIDFSYQLNKNIILVSDSLHATRIFLISKKLSNKHSNKLYISCAQFNLTNNFKRNLAYIVFAYRESAALILNFFIGL